MFDQIDLYQYTSLGFLILHITLIICFSIRVIHKKFPVGATLSWLLLLNLLPYAGIVLYLLFGERYLGLRYHQRAKRLQSSSRIQLSNDANFHQKHWVNFHPMSADLATYEMNTTGIPALIGNQLQFFNRASVTIANMIRDIDQSRHHCHLEFYIWHPGGLTLGILDALIRAKRRGVECRVLLDAVGSQYFFRTGYPTKLKQQGVEILRACPIGLIPWRLARYDLRNHRKSLIVDGQIAYAGSFNLIDPSCFKQDQGVGEWIDVMARVEGPAATAIDAIFRWYWNIESGQNLALLPAGTAPSNQGAVIQVIPTGPDNEKESILHTLLQAAYSATQTIRIVTPYFVPDTSLAQALIIASRRNVKVEIIVPKDVDSFLVRYASRSYYQELMDAGIDIYFYQDGLLHTKCVILDSEVSFFGTVNMDSRSLWLNFEMTMIIYTKTETQLLAELFEQYQKSSIKLSPSEWRKRPISTRFFENLVHLFSPLI